MATIRIRLYHYVAYNKHRRNLRGDAGVRSPHFLKGGGRSPHFFEVEKNSIRNEKKVVTTKKRSSGFSEGKFVPPLFEPKLRLWCSGCNRKIQWLIYRRVVGKNFAQNFNFVEHSILLSLAILHAEQRRRRLLGLSTVAK